MITPQDTMYLKKTKIVYRNLMALNTAYKCRFKQEDIYICTNV